jgi:hypothetical protein
VKGIVFNLLEEVVTRDHGRASWDGLLADAGLGGVYTSLGSYPDSELVALVAAAAAALGIDGAGVTRWLGQESMPLFAARYPRLFAGHPSTRSFVLTLNDIIHPEVRKLYPGADVPEFGFADSPDGRLELEYCSPRRMCAFAEGLLEGAAAHFGETLVIEHPECMLREDARCLLILDLPA